MSSTPQVRTGRNARDTITLAREVRNKYKDRPYDFIQDIFFRQPSEFTGAYGGLAKWQEEFLIELQERLIYNSQFDSKDPEQALNKKPLRFAFATGHGVGKSALCAMVTCWSLSCLSNLEQVVTAGTFEQLKSKTWSEFKKWLNEMPGYLTGFLNIMSEEVNQLVSPAGKAKMTNYDVKNPDAFQGLHATNVIMIFDEASQIPKVIWDVSEGAFTVGERLIWLAFGNPTRTEGMFYDVFHQDKYQHNWTTRNISLLDVDHIDPSAIQIMKNNMGENSDEFKVRALGQFPDTGERSFFDNTKLNDVINRPFVYNLPSHEKGGVLGIDVAAGGKAKTAICYRTPTHVYPPIYLDEREPSRIFEHVVALANELDVCYTMVDTNGSGIGLQSHLKLWGQVPTEGVMNQESAVDKDNFFNRRAEIYSRLRDWMDIPTSCFTPGCDDYFSQMRHILYKVDASHGKLQLDNKADMFGKNSSDAIDALTLTFALKRPFTPVGRVKNKITEVKHAIGRAALTAGSWMS